MREIKKILIVYPYFTENIIQIFKKFGSVNKNIKFIAITPSNFKKSIYLPRDIDFQELPNNFELKSVYFFSKRNKNPIINPLSFFFCLAKFKPQVVLFLDEAFSINLFITGLFSLIFNFKAYFYSFENTCKKYNLLKRIIISVIKKLIKSGFICNEGVMKVFKKNNYFPKVKKIWWGVDVENFSKEISLEEKNKIKRFLGILENQKIIGFVGRFVPEKGIYDLVESFKTLETNAILLFIGDGPEKINLEKIKAKKLKKIIILPTQDQKNLAKYYQIMDVLVLPSKTTDFWKEQYGRVLIEAMASGVLIIGSNSGAIPEIIDRTGTVFPEGDIKALKEAIKYELDNKNEEKIKKLKERAKLGSIDNFVKEIMKLIIRK